MNTSEEIVLSAAVSNVKNELALSFYLFVFIHFLHFQLNSFSFVDNETKCELKL